MSGTEQIVQVLAGIFAILIGLGVLWALLLGIKQIGSYMRTAFRGNESISRKEADEIKQSIEALKMLNKATNAPVK